MQTATARRGSRSAPVASADHEEVERRVREALDAGDSSQAAALFIRHCGGDILSFLAGRMHGSPDASDVFADFAEDVWRGLPGFRWQTSLRSWAYTLARNAAFRHQTATRRRRRRFEPLPSRSEFGEEVARLHSATRQYLRTEIKVRMRQLRERLSPDDQTLLVLRVDRGLSWKELAVVMSGREDGLKAAEQQRLAANLRRRFHNVKERLRALAKAEHLIR
jgi:RNA polymerase sigma-70 factor (ECF subfamily)